MAILDPVNSAVDRIRLSVTGIGDIPFLSDDIYQYYIDKNNQNEWAATKECAYIILGILAKSSNYNRVDVIISDNRGTYKQYADFLTRVIQDPRTAISVAGGYAGGISISDMESNDANIDNNIRPTMYTEDAYPSTKPNTDWL